MINQKIGPASQLVQVKDVFPTCISRLYDIRKDFILLIMNFNDLYQLLLWSQRFHRDVCLSKCCKNWTIWMKICLLTHIFESHLVITSYSLKYSYSIFISHLRNLISKSLHSIFYPPLRLECCPLESGPHYFLHIAISYSHQLFYDGSCLEITATSTSNPSQRHLWIEATQHCSELRPYINLNCYSFRSVTNTFFNTF